jgi:radical SAM superfamily enzyme YgiQ (UPF0313 family)
MKILLIQPASCDPLMDQIYLFEPLALEYLAAGLLEDHHEVRIVDGRIDRDIITEVDQWTPDIVGITAFTSQINLLKQLANQAHAQWPDCFVVIGGHHATVQPQDLNDRCFDAVVIGEGVFTLRQIVTAIEQGLPLLDIAGLALPSAEGMIYSPIRPYTDLNELPFPARELTRKYRKHYFSEWFKPLASVRTSLGCTARCNFCALWSITGGTYLRRDPDLVVEELKRIEEANVFFCDDESMCDSKRMSILADKIEQAGIRKNYFLYARVDTIVRHPDLFRQWQKIGLKQVFVGMEDYSDERLQRMNKGVSVAQQEQAVALLNSLGIMMYASFMVDPDYSQHDFKALARYIRRLKLNYATFTVMTPLPGTELYQQRKGEMISHKPELFDMLHSLLPTRLPAEEFYDQMATLYEKAVPVYRVLPTLAKFGCHGLLIRLKLFHRFLKRLRRAHLDY